MTQEGGAGLAALATNVTPLVLTLNEAPNIARCLERLTWARRVVVLDSGSTDDTVRICRRFSNVDVAVRTFDDHATQWNHGVGLVATPWVLSLDADYVLSDAFLREVESLACGDDVDAFFAPFRYCIAGRPLRASLYPPRAVLFRRSRCRYESDGHTQRLMIPGRSQTLSATIDHDDRKSFGRWRKSQARYARLEADKLLSQPSAELSAADRIRRTIVLGPPAVFVYTLFGKRTVLDGWPGWYYTLQRTIAEVTLSAALLRRQLTRPFSSRPIL